MTQTLANPAPAASPLGTFERYLSLWVLLAILAGLGLGLVAPAAVGVLAGLEYASVNLVVAVLIWAMIYPMMVGVDFGSIRDIGRKPKGLVITLVPAFAWWLDLTLWEAFVMDIGLIVFFLIYTFVFNWVFDRVFGLPASALPRPDQVAG